VHEYSVVIALIEQCEKYVKENSALKVVALDVKIGQYSGVEPELFSRAFEVFKEKTVCDGAQMKLQIQPLVIQCHQCQTIETLKEAHYVCPSCNSSEISVLEGEELLLMSLEMQ